MDADQLDTQRAAEIAAHNSAMRAKAVLDSGSQDDVTLFAQAVHRIQANPDLSGYNLGVVQSFLGRLSLAPRAFLAPAAGVGPLPSPAVPLPLRLDPLPAVEAATVAAAPLAGGYAPLVAVLGPLIDDALGRLVSRLEATRSAAGPVRP